MDNEFHIVGTVSKDGKLLITGKDEMNDFLSKWKNAKVVGTLRVFKPESTEAMIGYYYGKILPDIQKAYFDLGNRFTIEETDLELRRACPMMRFRMWSDPMKAYIFVFKTVQQLSREEMKYYIEWIQQFASENLHLVLTD